MTSSAISSAPAPAPERPRVYVAFEGGGAKGVAHVGALSALDESVDLRGVAGTSAGAIVAALRAAGFSADELVNAATGTHLLDWLKSQGVAVEDARSFFGRPGWTKVRLLRAAARSLAGTSKVAVAAGTLAVLASLILAYPLGRFAVAFVAIAWGALGAALLLMLTGGLASALGFRDILETTLRLKLRGGLGGIDGSPVTFAEFDALGCLLLKIVATDLTTGQLRLFSKDETPDIAVADAVTASICLPIVFSIWPINLRPEGPTHYFVDGGLVSNLPVWPFDEERAIDPGAVTVAVEIVEVAADRPDVTPRDWIVAAARAAAFGASVLNKRAIGRLESLKLTPSLTVLDFDMSRAKAAETVVDAREAAKYRLVERLVNEPARLREATTASRALTLQRLAERPEIFMSPPDGGIARVRASVARPDQGAWHTIKLDACVGFDDDADQDMTLPLRGSFVGQAWLRREAFFQQTPFAPEHSLPGPENAMRRLLVWKAMTWSFSIPILDQDDQPRLVVAIDGNHALTDDVAALQDMLSSLAFDIATNVGSVVLDTEVEP